MKILRAYAVAVMICVSITSVAACVFVADENAKKISFGYESTVAVINSADENLYENAVDFSPVLTKIKNAVKKAASIAPPPVNNIYWFVVNAGSLLN